MQIFSLAISPLPMALSAVMGSTDRSMNPSMTVFVVMVGLAAIGWTLAMVGMAGGFRRLPRFLPKNISVDSVALVVLLVTIVFLIALMYRGWIARSPARARVDGREPVRQAAEKLPSISARAPVGKNALSTRSNAAQMAHAMKPADLPTPPSTVHPAVEHAFIQAVQSTPAFTKGHATEMPKPARYSPPPSDTRATRPNVVIHGARILSEPQARSMCGAVRLFAGAEVYIKWGAGANAEQLASQLSQVMDCARVTVTYASETPGLQGHGVRVGTHVNEGETSDRIRPFADAITAALKAQGFNVSEVTGSNIPANQTAIFIGSD